MTLQKTVVAALIALFAFSPASPIWAQVIEPPPIPMPQPPVILVPNAEGTSVPVHVRSVDVDVKISGFLAETTLVMTFHNPNSRILEGELVFPLPEGSTISGYGLDVGGELVDGVVIERQQARVAFESEMRQNVDPGLAEWVQGSNFRTRIYPFPANGSRTIKISYVSDLTIGENAATYLLPLAYQEELESFHLRVAVGQGQAAPSIEGGSLSNIDFNSWESQFVAETTLTDISPREDLVVAVPFDSSAPIIERTEEGYVYFAVQDVLPELETFMPRSAPSRVAILFDASASRNGADVERELGLLRAWLESNPAAHADLVVLRDRVSAVRSFEPSPTRNDDLIYAIQEEPLDGGTDLAELQFPASLSGLVSGAPTDAVDAYLFLSDGLGSLGEPGRIVPEAPVIAITSSAEANHAWLRHLAEASGGRYLNLQRLTDDDALAAMGTTALRLMGVEFAPDALEQVQVDSPLAEGGRMIVTGRITADNATITLRYGIGTVPMHTSTVSLNRADATEGNLVARYWAQLRIVDLALSPDRNRDELRRLGTRFNLVTPQTSYIVLETIEQHLEHGIPPAPSRTAMLEEYERRLTVTRDSEVAREAAKLGRVVGAWQARVAWWSGHASMPATAPPPPVDPPIETTFEPTQTLSGDMERQPLPAQPEEEGEPYFDDMIEMDEVMLGSPSSSGGGESGDFGAAGLAMEEVPAVSESSSRERRQDRPAGPAGAADAAAVTGSSAPDSAGAEQTSGASSGTIEIQAWNPDTPYLRAMQAVEPDQAYGVYLDYIHEYGRAPAFYLDAASYLYRVGQPVEARRVLTNISELELADGRLLRVVAYKLQEEGELDLAIRLFEEVLDLRPEEPQSRRDLAVALGERAARTAQSAQLDDPMAPVRDWARAVELIDAMVRSETGRFEAIEMPALMEANAFTASMERYAAEHLEGVELPENPLDPRLRANLDIDARVILRWDTDETDMDLWVTEPSGERCYYGNNSTAYGAMYGRDYTIGYGPEEYLIRTAPDGGYLVQANFFGSRQQSLTGGTTLQVDIFTDWGRPNEKRHRGTIRLSDRGETVTIGTVTIGDDESELSAGDGIRTQ